MSETIDEIKKGVSQETPEEQQIYNFNTESDRILKIVIDSLYSEAEVFLRELISNSCDALDKLRYQSISDSTITNADNLKITITPNKEQLLLTISDNGIGMTKEELIKNLGTVARSGTQNFLESINDKKDLSLIGQFGVGFYSVFMVSKKVQVISCKDTSSQYMWESNGIGTFSIKEVTGKPEARTIRGTSIILHLKEESKDYTDKFKLEHLVSTYSNYVPFPIEHIDEKGESEQLNAGSPIWEKPKHQITSEEHDKFFQGIAHVGGSPWMILHNKNEGLVEYTNLLYIPSIKPFDLFHPDRKCSVRLHIKKVFITDSNVKIIPQYLRFIRGIVDCKDLPLNVSRETLQHNSIMSKVSSSLEDKIINSLSKKLENDKSDYDNKFWSIFGAVLKEGLCEYMPTNKREKLLSICRFFSYKQNKLVSIDEYIDNMQEGQKYIYYLIANSLESAKSSPQLEGFESRNIDVLIMIDSVDDFWVNVNTEYKEVKFKSITRSDIDLEEQEETESNQENSVSKESKDSILEYIKKVLGEKISGVQESKKLSESPVCLSAKEGAMDMRMERFMFEQNQLPTKTSKILEINMKHQIIMKLSDKIDTDHGADVINLLFAQACINQGEELNDTSQFSKTLNKIILDSL